MGRRDIFLSRKTGPESLRLHNGSWRNFLSEAVRGLGLCRRGGLLSAVRRIPLSTLRRTLPLVRPAALANTYSVDFIAYGVRNISLYSHTGYPGTRSTRYPRQRTSSFVRCRRTGPCRPHATFAKRRKGCLPVNGSRSLDVPPAGLPRWRFATPARMAVWR